MTAQGVLVETLKAAVPLEIHAMAGSTFPQRRAAAQAASAQVAAHGDDLQYGGRHCAATFAHLARGLAALAYQPGGVTFAGAHWCVYPHPGCPHLTGRPACCGCGPACDGGCGCGWCANGCRAATGGVCCREEAA